MTPDCQSLFTDLETAIWEKFLPTVMGSDVSCAERVLLSLPARWGGLGIFNPTETADMSFKMSMHATDVVVQAVKCKTAYEMDVYMCQLTATRTEFAKVKEELYSDKFDALLGSFDSVHQRAILRAKNEKISGCLTVLPLAKSHFDLSPQEFWDALAIRYRKPLRSTPDLCDGCGVQFSLSHALSCRRGGLVIQRYNKVRDSLGDLASLVWSQVKREPVVREADEAAGTPALIAYMAVRSVCMPQAEALFDVRVIDTDAQSYCNHTPREVINAAENQKKSKYTTACEERRASFTPICCSVDGVFGSEAEVFLKRLGERLAAKWDRGYSQVIGWLRARMSFAILQSSILCVRGARTRWRSLGLDDGAPLQLGMK